MRHAARYEKMQIVAYLSRPVYIGLRINKRARGGEGGSDSRAARDLRSLPASPTATYFRVVSPHRLARRAIFRVTVIPKELNFAAVLSVRVRSVNTPLLPFQFTWNDWRGKRRRR